MKINLAQQTSGGGNATQPAFPLIDRSTVANLPSPQTVQFGATQLVTDSTAVAATSGIAPVGGGSNLGLVWNNGQQWILL